MHPAVRVVLVLALALVLARASVAQALVAGLLVLALLPWGNPRGWRRLAIGLWRLKFLFLSIAVLYLLLTPGTPIWPALHAGATPSREGLAEGLLRVAALAALLAAVHWLMRTLTRAELVAGLSWTLQPLRWLGADVDRLAIRLVLTLEIVPRLRVMVAATRRDWRDGHPWRQPARFAAQVFARALEHAERRPPPTVTVPQGDPPPLNQILPLAAAAGAVFWWL
ncbi:CbiQ family ECF transporter T component [Alkalilimnicola ehrlichii MLHE-1]|uniref:Cobalt transport protein n=1 Tax=Alkalilimnicola ehrlichii (strain ATCC BAA-1101 / DSM 17681 / MLHE-1) TaxID=187272 RepID=Q0A9A5_ALKEH|nr:CbiQ family ECF transporter T component [Alkalilimnicola ehrlichii]ABI56582.1 hypothetical protein Mlg_1233 [Alkalilimnicola ehrlichii MLHE-1]